VIYIVFIFYFIDVIFSSYNQYPFKFLIKTVKVNNNIKINLNIYIITVIKFRLTCHEITYLIYISVIAEKDVDIVKLNEDYIVIP
jgi:hypothetical protein